jgi:carbonic anhydrase/acetyltransferase-like protein (isoleucine patch superfamily)
MCVIGRNTFIGAGNTFTDYNLIPKPIRALDGSDKLAITGRPVLGGCVGHNCRIGAGMVIFPARTIESDVVLLGSKDRRVIERDVRYEDSDHFKVKEGNKHPRQYPRRGESDRTSW